jgi:pimeloyl-ACP methyl ester carboxylesterase
MLDGYAREKRIRLVTPDRPGQGATPRVELESRIEVAHQQMLSLLEHIGVKKVTFLTHSAGV